ncbi:hypothetical protein Agub_g11121, partial [Astrephomene gubernaculifera]
RVYHYDNLGTGVHVYVVDSGIRASHQQFRVVSSLTSTTPTTMSTAKTSSSSTSSASPSSPSSATTPSTAPKSAIVPGSASRVRGGFSAVTAGSQDPTQISSTD